MGTDHWHNQHEHHHYKVTDSIALQYRYLFYVNDISPVDLHFVPFSVGLCVDFCAHIVHGFLTGKGSKGKSFTVQSLNTRNKWKDENCSRRCYNDEYNIHLSQMRGSSTSWRILRRRWWMVWMILHCTQNKFCFKLILKN